MKVVLLRLVRVLLLLAMLLVVAGVFALLVWHDRAVAQWRAAVVVGGVIDIPVVSRTTRLLTGEPSTREAKLGGQSADVYVPAGDGPSPAVVLLTGADAQGRRHPEIVRTSRALARAGFVVFTPDTPGLRAGELGASTVEATGATILAAAEHELTANGRVALIAVSAGGSLALTAAGQPETQDRVSAVVAVAPFADVRTVAMLATTSHYRSRDGSIVPYAADEQLAELLARSVLAAARTQGVPAQLVQSLQRDSANAEHPLDPFRRLNAVPTLDLGELDPVLRLLGNEDPNRFDELYADLPPELRQDLGKLAPIAVADQVRAHVEILSGQRDKYFPLEESRRLEAALPDARLTVTPLLDHAIPSRESPPLKHLLAFNAAVVRALDAADG